MPKDPKNKDRMHFFTFVCAGILVPKQAISKQ